MGSILVIEDDGDVAGAIGAVLRRAGHEVTWAADGEVGLTKFVEIHPDLVITDIIMPEKEGIETIRELRRSAPDLPIIAISGGGRIQNLDFLEMARKLGATEALGKPFSNDELVAVVARCLDEEGAPPAEH